MTLTARKNHYTHTRVKRIKTHLVKLSEMQSYFQRIGASAISKCKAESL